MRVACVGCGWAVWVGGGLGTATATAAATHARWTNSSSPPISQNKLIHAPAPPYPCWCERIPSLATAQQTIGFVLLQVAFSPAFPEEPLFLLSDGPHAVKKGRNSAEKSGNPKQLDKRGRMMREIMVPAGQDGALIMLCWTDAEKLLDYDKCQMPRLLKITHGHVYLNPFTRMRCGLATELFQAVIKYDMLPSEVKNRVGAPGNEHADSNAAPN